jgi:chromate transport protein ChrA
MAGRAPRGTLAQLTGLFLKLGTIGFGASVGLMAGVTAQLGRTALFDPLTVAVAIVALLVIVRWRPNSVWLILAGALIGLLRGVA